jgi:hypothetical protein
MRDGLKAAFPGVEMSFDRKVDGGCSRRRPDVFMDCLTHVVIVECDENRHAGYSCENKRMMELFEDCGRRPIVFIRFNPDACGRRGGCFIPTPSGLRVNRREWGVRMRRLVECVGEARERVPSREISIEHLFYE